ncbi:MAG: nicotinate-nucleotide adenylyltransferase [Nitrospirota bacterium]
MRIGIFGGTFNPIHYGHLRAAEEARERLDLDKILFVPSGNPPLKTSEIANARHRYKMVRLAIVKNRFFDVLDIECSRPGKSYTVNTMETLIKFYRGSKLYFILGIDTFLDLPNWRQPEKLISLVNFAMLSRPGSKFIELLSSPYIKIRKNLLLKLDSNKIESCETGLGTDKELVLLRIIPMGISSTDIRRRIREGLTIKYMLPEDIEYYIISNKLYHTEEGMDHKSAELMEGGDTFKK